MRYELRAPFVSWLARQAAAGHLGTDAVRRYEVPEDPAQGTLSVEACKSVTVQHHKPLWYNSGAAYAGVMMIINSCCRDVMSGSQPDRRGVTSVIFKRGLKFLEQGRQP